MNKRTLIIVAAGWLALVAAPLTAADYFEDTFGGDTLDPRWTQDISSANLDDPNYNNPALYPDGNPSILTLADGRAVATCHQEAYNHLETPIDASGEFTLQATLRVNSGMGPGATHLAVYWDPITYVILEWGRGDLNLAYSDAEMYYTVSTAAMSDGWEFQTLKLEFTADTIKCYAKRELDSSLTYWPALDIPRVAVFTQPNALLIIGKGHQSPDYTNPDLDNDAGVVYGNDYLGFDSASYMPLTVDADFFVDSFDGPDLDPRWFNDNSPSNINDANYAGGSGIAIISGQAVAYPTHQEAYNHLETSIDASKNFAVQIDSRINSGMGAGANHMVVYWDINHWISFTAGRDQMICSEVRNDSGYVKTQTDNYYAGWNSVRFRIEFLESSIKFFAMEFGDPNLAHYPVLDLPRDPWTRVSSAKLIIGKGWQWNHYITQNSPFPDFDNDSYGGVWGDDGLYMDNAIYEPLGTYECGHPGTVYLDNDLNHDCYVDINDFTEFAQKWLWCSDPVNTACDSFWLGQSYFIDEFDSTEMDPRWHEDNSPSNPAGSELIMVAGTARSDTNLQEAYHHLETPIDTTANFTAQAKVRCSSGMGTGAPRLIVYWDVNHFVNLEAGRGSNCSRESYDGANFTVVQSTKYSAGWDYFNMQIEFTADTLKFYIADYYSPVPYELEYYPALDMPRQPWMTGPALMIIGKADQWNQYAGALYPNPDFDNDSYGGVYSADHLIIDNASYQPLGVANCQDSGAVHFNADLNQDCYVTLEDFALLGQQWLWCTDPANTNCDSYW